METHTSFLRLPQAFLERALTSIKTAPPAALVLAGSTTTVALLASWIISDYRAWKAFGTGGTPPTPAGYWRMTKIRFNRALAFNDDLRDASKLDASAPSFLKIELPNRTKDRPKIQARTMPQRQVPGKLDYDPKSRLFALPERFCYSHPQFLEIELSHTEGRSTDAIYATGALPNRPASAFDKVLKNEIAHVHPAENSLHVWLSEADAKKVIEKGWGERFPLSAMGMCHKGWTFVYAPRDMDDVDVIEEIVKAGCAYVTGERVR